MQVRYGDRRMCVLLRRGRGWAVTAKRAYRLYKLEDLTMRHKPPRRRIAAMVRADRTPARGPSQVWAMDWMYDKLFDRRCIWVLTVLETWSRVSPVLRVCRTATALEVTSASDEAVRRFWAPRVWS